MLDVYILLSCEFTNDLLFVEKFQCFSFYMANLSPDWDRDAYYVIFMYAYVYFQISSLFSNL